MRTPTTLAALTNAAKRSTATILAQSGEMPDGVDALLRMDDDLEQAASAMIRGGWARSMVHSAIEDGIVRPASRPRRDPTAARVVRSYRLHPTTIAALDAEAKRAGESAGQVIDRLVQGLDHG